MRNNHVSTFLKQSHLTTQSILTQFHLSPAQLGKENTDNGVFEPFQLSSLH